MTDTTVKQQTTSVVYYGDRAGDLVAVEARYELDDFLADGTWVFRGFLNEEVTHRLERILLRNRHRGERIRVPYRVVTDGVIARDEAATVLLEALLDHRAAVLAADERLLEAVQGLRGADAPVAPDLNELAEVIDEDEDEGCPECGANVLIEDHLPECPERRG